ncbi:hypothetical protein BJ986_002654 [Phycicoccus badiiscoriae]|uniref:Uncharacterized protein n=1 Tax=Pedococcus badiiscoriae TaxID=642776 RepID=A0A852WG17_9MICO|nr:hypothetical protein [Pedococcus badiiscoriae]NYG08167.1 hypothetical protein [Pedococcus badiiscoriae]
MTESRQTASEARTLSAEERADLVRLLRCGSWRPFGGLRDE